MQDAPRALEDLARRLESSLGHAIEARHERGVLFINAAGGEAVVAVTVFDADRPSYSVSYPSADPDAVSLRDVREATASGVVFEGLMWIISRVLEDGFVLPEFPHERLRRAARVHRRR